MKTASNNHCSIAIQWNYSTISAFGVTEWFKTRKTAKQLPTIILALQSSGIHSTLVRLVSQNGLKQGKLQNSFLPSF